MELRINLYTAATGISVIAAISLIALAFAGTIPAMHGLVLGNAALITAGVAFVTSRLERFASMAFRRGHEVGMEDAAIRNIAQRR